MQATLSVFQALVARAAAGGVELVNAPSARPAARASAQVWVWRVSESLIVRPGAALAPAQTAPMPPAAVLHVLVFAADLATLEAIRVAVHQSPVLGVPPNLVTVRSEALPVDELLALFLAAKAVPRPGLAYALQACAA